MQDLISCLKAFMTVLYASRLAAQFSSHVSIVANNKTKIEPVIKDANRHVLS